MLVHSKMFRSLLIFCLLSVAFTATVPRREKSCPRGWLQYESTCYFRQPDLLNYEEATKSCEKRGAKLYEVNDTFEWEAVKVLFPDDYYFTWVNAEVEEELIWLYEPYDETLNGKNSVATCIACYTSPTKVYNYYYGCYNKFHSICEKPLDAVHQWVQ